MILVFGSINLDVIHHVAALPQPGETVLSQGVRTEAGGKGANQAVAAALDGGKVAFAGAVGRDAAAGIALAGLVAAGVDVCRVAHTDAPSGVASVVVDSAGRNQIAVGSGANLRARADQVADADLTPGTILVVQMEVDPEQTFALVRRASALGARVILNLAPAGKLPGGMLRPDLDWLILNQAEAAWLGNDLRTGPDTASLHEELGPKIVRTCGADGLDATWDSQAYRLAAHSVAAVDTTGAGDCFVGVLAAALDTGLPPGDALRRANVAAALSCLKQGSQGSFPGRADIDAALPGSPAVRPMTRDDRYG